MICLAADRFVEKDGADANADIDTGASAPAPAAAVVVLTCRGRAASPSSEQTGQTQVPPLRERT
jgi:hypothetical protein